MLHTVYGNPWCIASIEEVGEIQDLWPGLYGTTAKSEFVLVCIKKHVSAKMIGMSRMMSFRSQAAAIGGWCSL